MLVFLKKLMVVHCFIKNIDKMNSKIQGKFLRVLEEKKYYRIGSLSPNNINFKNHFFFQNVVK